MAGGLRIGSTRVGPCPSSRSPTLSNVVEQGASARATWDSNRPQTSTRAPHERILDRMVHRSYTPAAPLADFVEDLWFMTLPAATRRGADLPERYYRARHQPEQTTLSRSTIACGQASASAFRGRCLYRTYDRFFVIDTAEEASLFGRAFQGRGAFPFFGLPASELVDAHVDLERCGPSGPANCAAARGRDPSDRQSSVSSKLSSSSCHGVGSRA